MGLPVDQHIQLYAEVNGEQVVRPYTPTTLDNELGHFDLVVKVYPSAPPKFPEEGVPEWLTEHMHGSYGGRVDHLLSG